MPIRKNIGALALMAALTLGGFEGGRAGAQEKTPPIGDKPAVTGAQTGAQPGLNDTQPVERISLAVTLRTSKKAYATGEPIRLTLTAKNTQKRAVRLNFSSGQRYEVELRKGSKRDSPILWRASQGMMFTQMVTSQSLAPGKSLVYTIDILVTPAREAADNSSILKLPPGNYVTIAPGTYTATGMLTTMGRAARPSASTTLTVK